MPRVRLDLATEGAGTDRTGPDIRIDTDVFATLSGERPPEPDTTPTIVRWLDCWRS